MIDTAIEKLLKVNLNLQPRETLLLFTDDEKEYLPRLVEDFERVALSITPRVKKVVYPSRGRHGQEPPEELWRAAFGDRAVEVLKEEGLFERVLGKEEYDQERLKEILKTFAVDVPDVVVALSYYSTTHTTFRKLLTDIFGARYASMPLFEPEMLLGPMNVDWDYVSKLSRDIADVLSEGEDVVIESPYGVKLEFSIKGRKGIADTGLITEPGSYGNLPAGEAFIAPIEDSAYGRLVIKYAPDRPLEREVVLKFKDGAVEEIEGFDEYRKELENLFESFPQARIIAEFGVGTNPGARRPDNVLEAEKILGTVHVAIGDNHTFGGRNKVPFHTDYVIFEPTVVVGGRGWRKKLLEKGKLQRI